LDSLTREKRSWNMSRIHSRNTKPETLVRSLLHKAGYRFRLHAKKLPGTPDIVLPKYRTVIFVHGCFWHRHVDCANATRPKTRPEFWELKFKSTVERDRKKAEQLKSAGWRVIIVWECELEKNAQELIFRISEELKGGQVGS
jgi:DNA mismatch endonuclease, patch repair protein